jgi:23S rRNA pseudouridine1911/1915/1917 synthase
VEGHRRHRFVVSPEGGGLRLDQALAASVPGLSRRQARVLLELGGVFVDGARVKVAGRVVRAGQVVVANVGGALARATKEVGAEARERDLAKLPAYRVVHVDDDLVVVDKPSGLLTAPTPEGDRGSLWDLLRRSLGGEVFVVHRIDLDTSGLLVFARDEATNRALSEVFRAHDLTRVYRAIVRGHVAFEERTIDAPVGGKRAVTHLRVLRRFALGATELECRLETGRTHQIRLHARGIEHSILGDRRYGERFDPEPPRLALHAAELGLRHPRTGEALSFESRLPPDLAEWFERLDGPAGAP